MMVMACPGHTSMYNRACDQLATNATLRETFDHLAARAAGGPVRAISAPPYSTTLRIAKDLAVSARSAAIRANIAMLKHLRQLHPEVGERLLIHSVLDAAGRRRRQDRHPGVA